MLPMLVLYVLLHASRVPAASRPQATAQGPCQQSASLQMCSLPAHQTAALSARRPSQRRLVATQPLAPPQGLCGLVPPAAQSLLESQINSKPATFANCCAGAAPTQNLSSPTPVPATLPLPDTQYNTARDNLTNPSPQLCCDPVLRPDVSIVVLGPTVDHLVGQPFNFEFVVSNTDALAKNVTVTSSLPAGLQSTDKPIPGEARLLNLNSSCSYLCTRWTAKVIKVCPVVELWWCQ